MVGDDLLKTGTGYMFPLLMLNRGFPFFDFDGHLGAVVPYDETNELHRHLQVGRDVLSSLVLSLSKDTNQDHVFPKESWDWLDGIARIPPEELSRYRIST